MGGNEARQYPSVVMLVKRGRLTVCSVFPPGRADHDSIHLSIAGEINTDPGEFRAPADSEFGPGARWTGASGGRPGYHVFY